MVNDDLFQRPDNAATPLTAVERRDLKPSHITFKHELNEAEQENIARGQRWMFARGARVDILTETFVLELHRRMLEDVWKWAGSYRKTERNIGIDWWLIPTELELHHLLDDVRAWVEYSSYPPDELAVRFHHRLVAIHPFPNGNGRHARLMADLLVMRLGGGRFTWGSASLQAVCEARKRYIDALKAADKHDIGPLLAFARS
jgi:Fic-DOC domain mobile mystery protein B